MYCRSCVKLYFIGQPILPKVVLSRALSLVREQRHTGLSLLFPCTIVNHSLTLEKYRRATNPKLSCLNWLVVVKWNQLHLLGRNTEKEAICYFAKNVLLNFHVCAVSYDRCLHASEILNYPFLFSSRFYVNIWWDGKVVEACERD